MTVAEFKKLIADLPKDLDEKDIWFVEIGCGDAMEGNLRTFEDPACGLAIVGGGD